MQSDVTAEAVAPLYERKDEDYFSNPRIELTELINGHDLRILEIGCGRGETGKKLLASGKARSVTGIEMLPEQASMARVAYEDVRVGDAVRMAAHRLEVMIENVRAGREDRVGGIAGHDAVPGVAAIEASPHAVLVRVAGERHVEDDAAVLARRRIDHELVTRRIDE